MRSDYMLYGLAIVFFIVTAISLAVMTEQGGRSILAVSTAILGLALIGTGYFMRPKIQTVVSTPTPATTQEITPEPSLQQSITTETPVVEVPAVETVPLEETPTIAEAPKVETITAEEPRIIKVPTEAAQPELQKAEANPVEAPPKEAPVTNEAAVEVLVAEPVAIVPAVERAVSVSEVAPVITGAVASNIQLTQVKGIGEKRAAQLKANGVNCVEDLAKSDAADLASKLKVSPKIVEKWVTGAKELTK